MVVLGLGVGGEEKMKGNVRSEGRGGEISFTPHTPLLLFLPFLRFLSFFLHSFAPTPKPPSRNIQ
jgi:hypothetical protein